jgi:Glyoxalase-like domain
VAERLEDSSDRVVLALGDELPDLAFQHAVFVASRWPDPAYPAQLHVDWRFTDGAEPAIDRVLRLGAIRPSAEHNQFVDPAGHPFCL